MPLARSSVRWSLPLSLSLRRPLRSAPWEKPLRGGGRSHTAAVTWPPPLRATTTISEGGRGRGGEGRNEEDNRDGDGGSAMMRKEMKRERDDPPCSISSRGGSRVEISRSITPSCRSRRWRPRQLIGCGGRWVVGWYAWGDVLFSSPMLEIRLCRRSFCPSFFLMEALRPSRCRGHKKRHSPCAPPRPPRARRVGGRRVCSHSRGLRRERPRGLSPLSASECSGHCRIMNSRHKTEATKKRVGRG